MRHYSDDEISDYLTLGTNERQVAEHLEECPACRERADLMRTIDSALGDPNVWEVGDLLLASTQKMAVLSFDQQIAAENSAAERMLKPLLGKPIRFAWSDIAGKDEFRTPGVVRVLCNAALSIIERHPRHSLEIADAAVRVARALPDDYYPAGAIRHVRAFALKDKANALRYLGSYTEALEVLAEAEENFEHTVVLREVELAVIKYVRSTVLYSMQRFDEALTATREVQPVFLKFKESNRYWSARTQEAVALFFVKDFEGAAAVASEVRRYAESIKDDALAARALQTLGAAEVELGKVGAARTHLQRSQRLFGAAQLKTEAARVIWTLGRLEKAHGSTGAAMSFLKQARDEFRVLEMHVDSALVTLLLAELYLVRKRYAAVETMCRDLAGEFRRAGMLDSALAARGRC